ncbi:hypothetical protein F383_18847 [Gossypium arboreum]|uniref:Uncharacterized protein n=1 Tax=Gossypium arboreum TaxID=29729 RepID=A0A0B0NRW7_GOSAR|nr:hypothetical protein F383_18847 [Gossypium arboreum]
MRGERESSRLRSPSSRAPVVGLTCPRAYAPSPTPPRAWEKSGGDEGLTMVYRWR